MSFDVMIVEDVAPTLKLLGGLFAEEPLRSLVHKVHLANSCEEALKMVCEEGLPDFMLLDHALGDAEGHDVLRRIYDTFQKVPYYAIVTATSHHIQSQYNDFMFARQTSYMLKPLDGGDMPVEVLDRASWEAVKQLLIRSLSSLQAQIAPRTIVIGKTEIELSKLVAIASAASPRNTVNILLKDRPLLNSYATLNEVMEALHALPEAPFVRIRHSIIVNTQYVWRKGRLVYFVHEGIHYKEEVTETYAPSALQQIAERKG